MFGVGQARRRSHVRRRRSGRSKKIFRANRSSGGPDKLLTQLIDGIGFTRDDVYIANVVKCRPPGNRDPEPDEIEACAPWLDRQLELIRPRVIVTLGNFATKLLLDTKDGITKLRGQHFPFTRAGVDAALVPTLHPVGGAARRWAAPGRGARRLRARRSASLSTR